MNQILASMIEHSVGQISVIFRVGICYNDKNYRVKIKAHDADD